MKELRELTIAETVILIIVFSIALLITFFIAIYLPYHLILLFLTEEQKILIESSSIIYLPYITFTMAALIVGHILFFDTSVTKDENKDSNR
ncbi:hypothetical protein HL742_001547 [Campylobacter upsaliensis]|nr:hypothetical protein [Campylobacter upsaliensis]